MGEVVLDVAVNWLEEPWHWTQISCSQGHNLQEWMLINLLKWGLHTNHTQIRFVYVSICAHTSFTIMHHHILYTIFFIHSLLYVHMLPKEALCVDLFFQNIMAYHGIHFCTHDYIHLISNFDCFKRVLHRTFFQPWIPHRTQGDAPEILWHHPLQRGSLCTVRERLDEWLTDRVWMNRMKEKILFKYCTPSVSQPGKFCFIWLVCCECVKRVLGNRVRNIRTNLKPCQCVSHVSQSLVVFVSSEMPT